MTASRDPDRLIHAFLHEGLDELPDPVYDAVRDRIEQTPQRADVGLWRTALMRKTMQYGLAAAAAAVIVIIGLGTLRGGPAPGTSPSAEPSATASASAPSSAVDDFLNSFLAARIAGEGAQQYLSVPEEEVPLLYATTSGAPYERAEFEPVLGVEWPYGGTAFKVRLFAGDTVIEQLFFMGTDGPLELGYVDNGFATDIAPTTEDGRPLAIPHNYFDGEVTLHAAHPWVFGSIYAALIPEGPAVRPTTDGGERQHWDHLWLLADPVPVGTGCQAGPAPADAEALAESIRSDPDLEATAPVAVNVGGAKALMMDVVIAAGASICQYYGRPEALTNEQGELLDINLQTGRRMQLYLFDAPEGSSMRILAIAIVASESTFERAVEAAAPVVESIEFHRP